MSDGLRGGTCQLLARVAVALLTAAVAVGCSDEAGTPTGPDGGTGGVGGTSQVGGGGGAGAGAVGGGGSGGAAAPCPTGMICPDSFPFHHDGDTAASSRRDFDGYGCATDIDESGPEVVYRVQLPAAGFLSAAVEDGAPGVDIDLHILSALDQSACLDRGNHQVAAHVAAGEYYVVADSYVSGGDELAGPYGIDIGYVVPTAGSCAMSSDWVPRLNDAGVQLPATGPVVAEAHLVTVDDGFGSSWPTADDEGIEHHYDVSFAATSFVMARSDVWAPQENSEYGMGSTGQKLPVVDEGWYINMMWSDRPAGGTRMIVQLPGGGPAVVAAAGWETGPGDPARLAGVSEEIHFYLGTGHLDELRIGFAVDQNLPLGPIDCP